MGYYLGSERMKRGIAALDLLQVAFVVLKLCKVIDWSWWWVLSPMWITAIVVIVLLMWFKHER